MTEENGSQIGGDLSARRPQATLAAELVLLLALAFAASYLLRPGGASIEEGISLGSLALAGIAAHLAARRSSRPVRPIWWLIRVVCMLWIIGEGGRLLIGSLGSSATTQWLLSGVFTLAAYLLLLLAALRVSAGSSVIIWSLGLLDAAVVAVALCAPWLESLVLPRLGGAGGAALLPQLLVPVLAGVVLVAASLAVYGASVQAIWLYVLLAAIAAGFAGDLLAVRHLLAGGGTAAAALGGWELRALLVITAAACLSGTVIPRKRRLLGLGMVRLVVVIVAYTAALGYAAFAFEQGRQLAGFSLASTISALLMLRLLVHALERHRHSEQLERALHEQERLAVMDALTGLYNRRFLDAELKLELDRGGRSQEPVGILLCDLDHFKQINDRYGHLVGDSVLREVARRLLGAVRNGDLVARYGGEEFVVLLPGGNKELLSEIGERCRRALDEAAFYLPGGHGAIVTISIGGACWPEDGSSARDLLEAADSALYLAKEQGRNRISVSERGVDRPLPSPEYATTPYRSSEYETALPAEPDAVFAIEVAAPPVEGASRAEKMERWAELVARALGLDDQAQRRVALATRFHDVGKSALPESILIKHGPLTQVEWELMQEHPERGATLVKLAPELESVAPIIREHHERFDGRGYPDGKSRDEISTEARIVFCCDAWDAMRRQRPYAPAMTVSEARAELLAGRGTQFDPDVAMAFLMFDEADLGVAEGALATPV